MASGTLPTTAIVGVFHNREDARSAIEELRRSGFEEHEIGLLTQNAAGEAIVADVETDTKAAQGAAAGVATGAGIGALWAVGIAVGFLPAIGPAIAGGLLASLLASAAGGAVVGGLVGALVGLGIPEDEAEFYEAEVLAGRTLVTVNAFHRHGEATEILKRHGGYIRSNLPDPSGTLAAPQDWGTSPAIDEVHNSTPHATGDLPHAEFEEDDGRSPQSADPRLPR